MGQEGGIYRPTFNTRLLLATAKQALLRGEKYQL